MERDGWLCVVRKLPGDKKHLQPPSCRRTKMEISSKNPKLIWQQICLQIIILLLSNTTKHSAHSLCSWQLSFIPTLADKKKQSKLKNCDVRAVLHNCNVSIKAFSHLSWVLSERYKTDKVGGRYCISKVSKFLASSVITFEINFSDGFVWNSLTKSYSF